MVGIPAPVVVWCVAAAPCPAGSAVAGVSDIDS
jgi:hypothetical protein